MPERHDRVTTQFDGVRSSVRDRTATQRVPRVTALFVVRFSGDGMHHSLSERDVVMSGWGAPPKRRVYFAAEVVFDCGWYINLRIGGKGLSMQFMQPQEGMAVFNGKGVTLNFKVEDVDAEHERLKSAGLQTAMLLEDHPWGDRGFSIIAPIGNSVYIYSDREPSEEFEQYYKG